MNGIFGFGWIDTIVKLLLFGIIGMSIKLWLMYLNKRDAKGVENE